MLTNKKLVIIGGTSGIGLSASRSFTKAGAKVLALGHKEEDCHKIEAELGEHVRTLCQDARETNSAQKAIDLCMEHFGGFDGLYHVAGGSGRKFGDGPLHELSVEGWNKTLELNLSSLMYSNQAAVQTFMKNGTQGSILNLSSVLASSPSPHFFTTHAYATAKAAIIGFSKSIAAYYAPHNIRINVLAPALVETPMSKRAQENKEIMSFISHKQPLDGGRIGKTSDLDGLACYFMSDSSCFTTGQVIAVDGAWSLSEGQYS